MFLTEPVVASSPLRVVTFASTVSAYPFAIFLTEPSAVSSPLSVAIASVFVFTAPFLSSVTLFSAAV